jgi:hypothetical protein
MTADNFCFHLQNRLIQTSQTGGQWYGDTSPFSIPWYSTLEGFCLAFNNSSMLERLARDRHSGLFSEGVAIKAGSHNIVASNY